MDTRLTILNSMAGEDFPAALDRHLEWGILDLDLRDGIFGHWLRSLPIEVAKVAAREIEARDLSVFCLSSSVFFGALDDGEEAFAAEHNRRLDQVMPLIDVFQPKLVRLFAPQLKARPDDDTAVDQVISQYPWVFDLFRTAAKRIGDSGAKATIENEAGKCVLSRPREFTQFFSELDLGQAISLTWDVQNQWATGVFPSVGMLDEVETLIGYYHVKGGQQVEESAKLRWNVALEDATWPVVDITREVIARGLSPVVCLNLAEHGETKPDYDYSGIVERDIAFMRNIEGIS